MRHINKDSREQIARILKTQRRQLNRKMRVFYFAGLPLIFLSILWIGHYFFVLNITNSMPIGLYYKAYPDSIRYGDIVGVCLDPQKAKLAMASGVLIENNQCDSGADMLIKSVIARPLDTITVLDNQMTVARHIKPSKPIGYLAPRFKFAPGPKTNNYPKAVLTFIDTGQYQAKGYWLYGLNNPRYSWDSRYFGEVSRQNIAFILKPLWLF